MSPFRVTIIGAGLTGSITACRLKRIFKENVAITMLEKSRGAGGRMSTNRSPNNPNLTCDLGAQYISVTPEYMEKHKEFYDELLNAGTLKEFTGKIIGPNRFDGNSKHFVTPSGINSLVKHFLSQVEPSPRYGTTVETINLSTDDQTLVVHAKEVSEAIISDAVVVTIPVPQLLKLQGTIQNQMEPFRPKLEKVQYSSRYALGMYFEDKDPLDVPWDCRYLADDDCVRFISIDNAKRGTGLENGYSICVHTTVPFGLKYLEESFDKVEPLIIESVKKILPELPEPSHTKCQRWRYSQIYKAYSDAYGCLVLNDSPLLIAGGDSFSKSIFDGCIDSSTTIIESLAKLIKSKI